ncbi:Tripartite ATP-independent periplasmic transporters, DctQ component [Vibrio aerogenes CECT 7868]|uniref:TRAP transporter small permease protein n=1 Tax=Vibrio aerogenes CECT 7868 TaxID=1216006 RepID=A0A1M5XR06_9VIBR|nr:TRAP transporter small permease [Vibrio aerogenes]SHI02275.1 Tripartite ATP-independent periplasmic transporters, DctQ component [Vibrio aerogenes CECT 7868]
MIIKMFNDYIHKVLRYLLTFFMVIMIAAVVWQVFTRFVIRDPSNFTDELSRYLLMWIGILGGAYTFSVKRHLSLELLAARMGERGKLVQQIFINLIIFAFSSIALIYGGYYLVTNTLHHGQISPGIVIGGHHLLIGYVYLVVPVSGVIICYFGLVDIIQAIGCLIKRKSQ